MGVYAILDEYEVKCASDTNITGIRAQSAVIINGHKTPPTPTFVYQKRGSLDAQLRDIENFLEKNIPKGYTVYVANDYRLMYGEILEKLKHRFVTVDMSKFPADKIEDLRKHLELSQEAVCNESSKCIEMIVNNRKCK